MLDSIVNYIDFLKKHFDLSVSIHGTDGRLDPYMSSLAPYNIHSNPYCLFVKSSKQNWNLCRIKQQRAAQAAKGTVQQWKGLNLLGCALMEVRDWLREQ